MCSVSVRQHRAVPLLRPSSFSTPHPDSQRWPPLSHMHHSSSGMTPSPSTVTTRMARRALHHSSSGMTPSTMTMRMTLSWADREREWCLEPAGRRSERAERGRMGRQWWTHAGAHQTPASCRALGTTSRPLPPRPPVGSDPWKDVGLEAPSGWSLLPLSYRREKGRRRARGEKEERERERGGASRHKA
jgi:hypothetical protein